MPASDFRRQRREREFQERVLEALEKPKKNRLIAVVNSGFFLWLLTAILVTLGGGYITNHQQCMRDADQIIARKNHLQQEILARQPMQLELVEKAQTLDQLPGGREMQGALLSDLSKVSFLELRQELETLDRRVTYDHLDDPLIEKIEVASIPLVGPPQQLLTDQDKLRLRKLQMKQQIEYDTFRLVLDRYAYFFEPSCGMWNTLMTALGYRVAIVSASVSAVYSLMLRGSSTLIGTLERMSKLRDDILAIKNSR